MTDTPKTPEDISTMTRERAGEVLAQMTKQYSTAAAKDEPVRPTDAEGNAISLPEGNIFLSPEEREKRNVAETKDYLEANGFPPRGTPVGDDLWDKIEERSPVSAELQAQVEKKLASLNKDEEWRKKVLKGDARAVHEFHTATGLIAAGKIQRQQS